jgi:hypothetical protein
MSYLLKPIIEDKFWIIESNGVKLGTLRNVDSVNFEVSRNGHNQVLDKNTLLDTWGIDVENCKSNFMPETVVTRNTDCKHVAELHGYPCASEPFNSMYDVQRKLPMYTKSEKSGSYHCAGYYVVKYENGWTRAFCPKVVTLHKYEYFGPYKTKDDMLAKMRMMNKA